MTFSCENSTFVLSLRTQIFIVSSIGALIKSPDCHCDDFLTGSILGGGIDFVSQFEDISLS